MLILLLSSFLPGSMSAQENEITRLRVMLQMENLPDRQAEIALHLMEAFRDLHIDSARHYAQLAQKWAIQSDVPLWMARAGMAMGRVQELEGRFREAVQQYLEVEQMLRTRNAGTDDLWFQLHYNLILCYSNTGPLDQALIHYDSAYSHLSSDDIGQKIQLNNAMGIMYSEVGHNHLAIKYFQHNLDIARQAQDSRAKAMAHYNIGLEYTTLQMADSGIAHFKKALPYFLENRSSDYLATLYTGLGENLLRQKKYREGLSYMEEAEKICLDLGHDGLACGDYALVAHAYWELNELDRALLFSQEALEVLDNTQEYSSQQRALKVLVEVYRLKGDYQKALEYSRRLMDLKDTVSRVEHQRALVSMEQKYRARERETQLENQSLELKLREDRIMRLRLQIALAVAGGILMLLLLFLIWRILRQKMQLNERLRELDQKKARFFANISHEFRTPLTLIMGPLARAMEDVRNRVVKRDLQLAYDNAGRMSKLIDEVLDLSKLEEGMLELKNAEVLLHRQVQRLFSAYESYADMRGIRMEIKNNLPENKIWWLDPDKFNKIVNNLLSNALKFCESGGRVMLHAESTSKGIQLTVEDDGPGISREDQARLFDRFYQGKHVDAGQSGGTGIGLALASELADLMGGALSVKSEKGRGSRFTLTLPARKLEKRPARGKPESEARKKGSEAFTYIPSQATRSARVLVVEDHPEMQLFLQEVLSPYYHCRTASDGQEALSFLKSSNFDLVVSDVMMPGMDGFGLLEKVRANQKDGWKDLPFMMLTARTLEEDTVRAFRLGVDDYLTKPFHPSELLARVDNLLQNRQSRASFQGRVTDSDSETPGKEELVAVRAENVILKNLDDPTFKVEQLARGMNYSQRQVERLIQQHTGLTPVAFIREIRLQKAYHLLKSQKFASVGEVRMEVGIENGPYFTRIFSRRFGINPSELLKPFG